MDGVRDGVSPRECTLPSVDFESLPFHGRCVCVFAQSPDVTPQPTGRKQLASSLDA